MKPKILLEQIEELRTKRISSDDITIAKKARVCRQTVNQLMNAKSDLDATPARLRIIKQAQLIFKKRAKTQQLCK